MLKSLKKLTLLQLTPKITSVFLGQSVNVVLITSSPTEHSAAFAEERML